MDDLLMLALIIMGSLIGLLLVIWGVMSLYFHIRNKKKRRAAEEREKAWKASQESREEIGEDTGKKE
ncbi:MAG: LapA family protein [Oscillospiraceae bacterium]